MQEQKQNNGRKRLHVVNDSRYGVAKNVKEARLSGRDAHVAQAESEEGETTNATSWHSVINEVELGGNPEAFLFGNLFYVFAAAQI